ncbi:MAG: hypothetical protein HZA03_03695 [Nitrospinae bacterium]|nr:hypothetical protein [Nitrospinota bacterium]
MAKRGDAGKILKKLKGGDLRSIGRANEAAREVADNPARFASLFEAIFGDDPVLRARAADACEKAAKKNRALLAPLKKRLFAALSKAQQQEVRWHLAQMLAYVKTTSAEKKRAAAILKEWFADDDSRIVRVMSLQALADFAKAEPGMRDEVSALIRAAAGSGIPSLAARARKLQKKMGKP